MSKNNHEKFMIGLSYYLIGATIQIMFGLLGLFTFGITVLIIYILEIKGIVNWGKFIPK